MQKHTKAEAARRVKAAASALAGAQRALASYDVAKARRELLLTRWRQPALWQRANGKIELLNLADFGVERSYGPADATTGADRRAVIVNGSLKVKTGLSGASGQRVHAISQRMRVMQPADARKLAELDRTIAKAHAARERLLGIETWREGFRWLEGDIADLALSQDKVLADRKLTDQGVYGRFGLEDRIRTAERELADANVHAKCVNDGSECGCTVCSRERAQARRDADARAEYAERVAGVKEMPAIAYVCRSDVDTPDWRRSNLEAIGIKLCHDRKVRGGYDAKQDGVFCPRCGLGIRGDNAVERGAVDEKALTRLRKRAGKTVRAA